VPSSIHEESLLDAEKELGYIGNQCMELHVKLIQRLELITIVPTA
jgi:hypothetical protein